MKKNRVIALLLCLMMTFSFVACGQKAPADADSKPAVEEETKTEEELLAEENEILHENSELWEKVFASMNKNVSDDTLSSNYGEILLSAVESAKDQFS